MDARWTPRLPAALVGAIAMLPCLTSAVIGPAHGQAPTHLPCLGFVAGAGGFENMAITNKSFFDALAELGLINGKTMTVVFSTADGDMARMPKLAKEMVAAKVDFLVVSSAAGCVAARDATQDVPIVCVSVGIDPVNLGVTARLQKPGGNIIGVDLAWPEGPAEQLRRVREIFPGKMTFGMMFDAADPAQKPQLVEAQTAAQTAGMTLVPVPITGPTSLEGAIVAAKASGVGYIYSLSGPYMFSLRKVVVELALKHDIAIVMNSPGYARIGGLADVGIDLPAYYRRAAIELMKPIMEGAKPGELNWIVVDSRAVSVNVNRKAAEAMGLPIDALAAGGAKIID